MKSTRECMQALVDGKKLKYMSGETVSLNEQGMVVGPCAIRVDWPFNPPKDWSIVEEWYENIPEGGVLCWVSNGSNSSDGSKYVACIIRRDSKTRFKENNHSIWDNATPCSENEIRAWLKNTPEVV